MKSKVLNLTSLNRNAYIVDDNIFVIQNSNSFPANATVFQTDLKTLETKKILNLVLPRSIKTVKVIRALFLNDFVIK